MENQGGSGSYGAYNQIVAEPLTNENFVYWFETVRNYLIGRDVWEVVDGSFAKPPEDGKKKEIVRWRKKNSIALHAILISCGTQAAFSFKSIVSEAKVAWDTLNQIYCLPQPLPEEQQYIAKGIVVEYDVQSLYESLRDNKWNDAKQFIDEHGSSALSAVITPKGQTALHVAAEFGHTHIVEELVNLVPPQNIEILDAWGHTPLATAAYSGVAIEVAQCMLRRNTNALSIADPYMLLPVTNAFALGYKQMGRYLYSVTPLEVLRPQNGPLGSMLLYYCFFSGDLDIALDLLQQCKELIFGTCNPPSRGEWSPIMSIASMSSTLPTTSDQLVFWKRWIYNGIIIQSTTSTNDLHLDIQPGSKSIRIQGLGQLDRFISKLKAFDFLGIKEIYTQKLMHAHAAQILSLVCESAKTIRVFDMRAELATNAIFYAAREGNAEFVEQLAKANPHLILHNSNILGTPFSFAIQNRQAEVFNLFHQFRLKNFLATIVDQCGNGLLHVAGMMAPSSQLNRISGAALQMQRELQWFKEVESVIPHGIRVFQNIAGYKPIDVFKESHKELRNEGEKWMKDTSSSCSVVGALIVTIMFAAAFTVPGGNNQETGYPMFLDSEILFLVFLISDALSLFFSTTSVLMFLGILTSRYAEEDFLVSLPKKLIIGLSTLFLSIATMMMAFSATILIMVQYRSRSWVFLPVIMLASIPITIFVLLQFPLLVQVVSSTYGPGIFKRKKKSSI